MIAGYPSPPIVSTSLHGEPDRKPGRFASIADVSVAKPLIYANTGPVAPLNPHRSREKTVDKYDRLAAEIVFKHFGAKADYSLAAVIAAALRESAAEAFDESAIEAGKLLHAHHVREYCMAEAAALRSTTRRNKI